MRPFITLAFLFAFTGGTAQISPLLRNTMQQHPSDHHWIRIEFTENVDCYALNHQFKTERLSVSERPKVVISQLQQQAVSSQEVVNELLLTELSGQCRNVQRFWIVNVMVMEATPTAIEALAQLSEVALIDLENSTIVPHDPIIREEEGQTQRTPNGVEPGLTAINAPAMWALGYTGRGRMVYDYDTGVWPTHPAFADRFLAHRFPMEQCWFGYFSNTPNGNVSDHGTHTLGTMAGLVEATNDTIGVAFGSYWIANDLVTSTVEALPPLANMMAAFEWALNPDGDISTTHDIPDVINNSWRWRDDPDTVQCGGVVVALMNAIEAAGIANVFSGGNSGPNNTTVNAPQRINTSEVNTFCVGSVNGNTDFPHPISNFSTIGPTQCPSGGNLSLEIHPEVVAPGQNVRSAWGSDGFNTISGTSMAAPHVSGAVLLLKEAFPYLSGEELLWALYLTAIDLGDPGEDNIFGMGIIDVHAAFLHLTQTYTPIDPTNVAWDLAITSATDPSENGITCNGSFATEVTFRNLGDSTLTGIQFHYEINGAGSQSQNWSGQLAPGQSETITISNITASEFGDLGLNLLAEIIGQPDEYDLYNNRWHIRFNRREPLQLPFVDGFEHGFELNDWLIDNEDGALTWENVPTSGLDWSGHSASVQCYSYNPRSNQKDGLVSNRLVIPSTSEPVWLLFDLAYQMRSTHALTHDTLTVQVSTDCADSFAHEIYRKAAEELSTSDTAELNFVPQFAWDWRRDSVSLSSFAGQDIMLKFETTNRKGNNIYIDNVKVFVGNPEPASVSQAVERTFRVYPNPTSDILTIELDRKVGEKVIVQVWNTLGQMIHVPVAYQGNIMRMNTAGLTTGLHILSVSDGTETFRTRFVKQ